MRWYAMCLNRNLKTQVLNIFGSDSGLMLKPGQFFIEKSRTKCALKTMQKMCTRNSVFLILSGILHEIQQKYDVFGIFWAFKNKLLITFGST